MLPAPGIVTGADQLNWVGLGIRAMSAHYGHLYTKRDGAGNQTLAPTNGLKAGTKPVHIYKTSLVWGSFYLVEYICYSFNLNTCQYLSIGWRFS